MVKGLPAIPIGSGERRAAGGKPVCQACGGEMVKKRISSGNCAGIALALIVLVVGLVITIVIPVVGWVVGPLIMLCALGIGGKRQKVWRCRSCRSVIPRE
ncbi:MAG TPA: hypothetical protein VHY37_06750 [Tepidisphaeraceae bacterium]|jgi:hypothetical protein|nr:hypothetical protein [Tepidisphaeraceae bacterium]